MKTDLLWKVYPNPVVSIVTIEYSLYNEEPVRVSLINNAGQVVIEKIIKAQVPGNYKEVVDVSGMPAGVYFIKLQAGEHIVTGKITKG